MSDARTRLIESTQELLWERGYAATSPKAILERAGAGQGSMYHHFAGKEQLAHAALERSATDVRRKADRALTGSDSPLDRIIAYLTVRRDVLRGCPIGRMTGDPEVMERAALHDVLETTFEGLRQLVTEAADEAVETGEFPPGTNTADLAEAVLAVVQGGYVLARASGKRAPFDRAVRGAVVLLEQVRTTTDDKEQRR